MEPQQQTQESLRERVDNILRGSPLAMVAVEEPREEAVEAISNLLQIAEEELASAQERVKRLKWELEKAQS